jgi:2-desacetyl-2-hydroxyethyl bacteriochlorophyllide A dehydrogenase
MKASYLLDNQMHVGDIPDPVPGKGQVLVRTHSCGICASDHQWLHNAKRIIDFSRECAGVFGQVDLGRTIVPGHEYCGEIVDYGPETSRRLKIGTNVTSAPRIRCPHGLEIVGHSNDFPGGFGEYMVLEEDLLKELPSSLDPDVAAMAEPLSIGLRHARTGEVTKDEIPIVVGCGAIGLAVIAGLKLQGARPIIAADYSASRRELALKMGADVVVDPREEDPYGLQPTLNMRRGNVIFECAGKRGVLDSIFRKAAPGSRIIVAGFCLEPDQIFIPGANMKRLTVIFGDRGQADDMEASVRAISDGKVDVESWIGRRIGLSEVSAAVDGKGDPEGPIRTIIDPGRM